MKNKSTTITNNTFGILILLAGAIITLGLLLLRSYQLLEIDLEVALAPCVVITLLAIGDKLLIYLFLIPLRFIYQIFKKNNTGALPTEQFNLNEK